MASVKEWEQLRALLPDIPHEHFEGMNECAICDKSLIECAAEEIGALRKRLRAADKVLWKFKKMSFGLALNYFKKWGARYE
jgi:hypothetical protein